MFPRAFRNNSLCKIWGQLECIMWNWKIENGNRETMFSIFFTKQRDDKKKKSLLTVFDYQTVNSLSSRHHYVNSSC